MATNGKQGATKMKSEPLSHIQKQRIKPLLKQAWEQTVSLRTQDIPLLDKVIQDYATLDLLQSPITGKGLKIDDLLNIEKNFRAFTDQHARLYLSKINTDDVIAFRNSLAIIDKTAGTKNNLQHYHRALKPTVIFQAITDHQNYIKEYMNGRGQAASEYDRLPTDEKIKPFALSATAQKNHVMPMATFLKLRETIAQIDAIVNGTKIEPSNDISATPDTQANTAKKSNRLSPEEVEELRNKTGLKVGKVYIPPSRQISPE